MYYLLYRNMYHWKIYCKAIVSPQYRIIGNFTVGKSFGFPVSGRNN